MFQMVSYLLHYLNCFHTVMSLFVGVTFFDRNLEILEQ